MVKIFKLHKFFGLSAGLVLLILGITGFFIDHKQWSFFYNTTFTSLPSSAYEVDKKLFEAYWIDEKDSNHRIVGGKRGIFESFDTSENFTKISSLQCLGIRSDENGVFSATSDGIYELINSKWSILALKGLYITSISISKDTIVAIVDKHKLIKIKRDNHLIIQESEVVINNSQLQESIKLSRLVRDLHYGRGLFDGDISLLINDYGAIVISLLVISAYLIWWLIHKKTSPKLSRKLIRWHANPFAILALIPLIILAITGVFLDHSSALKKFMNSVTISHNILPPVYSSLRHDIWSVDYDGYVYRIGNRYGVYKSDDLKTWVLENKGLAFRMIRKKDSLYVSGMGAPNRIYDGEWNILSSTPHMFRDVIIQDKSIRYFSTHKSKLKLPIFKDATLYALMMTLHDGSFFSSWWVWINDFASFSFLILGITGTIRWLYKKRKKKSKLKVSIN